MRPPSLAVALPIPILVFSLLVFAVPPVAAAASRRSSNPPGFVRMMPSRTSSPPASTSLTAPGPAASAPSRSQANTRSTPSTVTASSWFGGDGSKSKDPQVLVRQGNVVDDTGGKGAVHVVRVSSYLTKGVKACFLFNVGNCMDVFRQGNVQGSIEYFDEAFAIGGGKIEPYLWQRGLSLYYAGKFKEGAEQFRKDVAVNPADTEESIWAFLCEAQLDGFDKARKQMLVVQTDPRPYMRRAYELFRGECTEQDLAKEGATPASSAAFYALLYLGLYAEAKGEGDKARNYIQASVATPYGKAGRDYMTSLAKVHLSVRGWV